jgi:hypothetical protein
MSLALPLSDSPIREMFDIRDLIDWRGLPTFRQGLTSAKAFLAAEPAARSVNSIVIRADGEIWLIRIGKRGGWKRVWNFGNPIARSAR